MNSRSPLKIVTVHQAKRRLGKLVEEVHRGSPVILVHNNQLVKLERYEPPDQESDGPRLESMLLEAARGKHSAYSKNDLESAARRARKRLRKK